MENRSASFWKIKQISGRRLFWMEKEQNWNIIRSHGKNWLLKHVLHLKAVDQAGNKTDQRITFKITKVLPKAVKQIVIKQDKIPSKKMKKTKISQFMAFISHRNKHFRICKMFCSYRKSKAFLNLFFILCYNKGYVYSSIKWRNGYYGRRSKRNKRRFRSTVRRIF